MNTNGFGGRKLSKNITVTTNEEKNKTLTLNISGEVEKFVTVTPKTVRLDGAADQEIKRTVSIVPEEKYPFKILETTVDKKEENIKFNLQEVKKEKGMEYQLIIENLKKEKGRYFDTVNLKTDSKIQPEIKIRVYGNISESLKDKENSVKKPM